jgi:hypothetical protein
MKVTTTPRFMWGRIMRYVLVPSLYLHGVVLGPPLRSCGQSSWLQIQRSRVRLPALLDYLRSSGSGTGSTQPREDN